MTENKFERLPDELGINQITNPQAAHKAASIEKPIRDLARDPEASDKIQELKPELDKEAKRLGAKQELADRKVLDMPITEIEITSVMARNAFLKKAEELDIKTVDDLIKKSTMEDFIQTKNFGMKGRHGLSRWLAERDFNIWLKT